MIGRALAVAAILGALTGAVAGCGPDVKAIPEGGPGPFVDCGGSGAIEFPISSLSPGEDAERPSSIADGLRRYDETAGLDAPAAFQHRSVDDAPWHVLVYRDDREAAVATGPWTADGPGPSGEMWTLEKHGTVWRVSGGGDCRLEPVPPSNQVWATISAPHVGLDRKAAAPLVLLTPRACGRFHRVETATVTETSTTVTVSWTVPSLPGDQACPGLPPLREHLPLSDPLGSRTLLDASVYPPAVVR